jgi:hypothetical protein
VDSPTPTPSALWVISHKCPNRFHFGIEVDLIRLMAEDLDGQFPRRYTVALYRMTNLTVQRLKVQVPLGG